MSYRTRRQKSRGLRPGPEMLETRVLMASHLTGTDLDGDVWVLDLVGPGDFNVTLQPDANGDPVALDTPGLINTIRIGGTGPNSSKLMGQVVRGPNGDGKVFFNRLEEFGGNSQFVNGTIGPLSIDIPDFWLGDTDPTNTGGGVQGAIDIPDGVKTLRFGGVDTTAFFGKLDSQRLNQNNANDQFTISMGLPDHVGTSIIVDSMISDAQKNPTNATQITQDSIIIDVEGRLNLFEANSVQGNKDLPAAAFATNAGTVVSSRAGASASTGAMDTVRVLGDAVNFHVTIPEAGVSRSGFERINTFFIGGETHQVSLTAPAGAKHVEFGKGMDTVNINAHTIETLFANRGALDSRVTTARTISQAIFGGDVVDTTVLSGYNFLSATSAEAQIGGGMTVLVAGDVTNSIFAASVDPQNASTATDSLDTGFGGKDDIKFPGAAIDAKVEGKINNADVAVAEPTKAFFANAVRVEAGPVIPPAVKEAPYAQPFPKPRSPGINPFRDPQVRPRALRSAPNNGFQATSTPAAANAAANAANKLTAASVQANANRTAPRGPANTRFPGRA